MAALWWIPVPVARVTGSSKLLGGTVTSALFRRIR